jgi:hypothetical protein
MRLRLEGGRITPAYDGYQLFEMDFEQHPKAVNESGSMFV